MMELIPSFVVSMYKICYNILYIETYSEITMIAFVNDKNVVVFITNQLSIGVKEMIAFSKLTPILIMNAKIGDIIIPPVENNIYEINDIVFVYHHGKNFKVTNFFETPSGNLQPVLEEIDPSNPKLPISIICSYCTYPKAELA